ncbi:ECF transporter S component [Methanocella conradii]|uniref:ECF transporter S component n=1 Tax=Methanocella conradii TaxID=1175444 RepID=UPI00157C7E04|nr:ECF transporter S component [Methanocella conradii]
MVISMANYYFSTKDLLFIAILSCLGGVASTYVGYLASTFGSLTGIPFAGQLLSGLHIFWIILIMAIVDKKGSGALAGLMKGFVEFISGSHLGAGVLLVSMMEGIFAEIGFWLPKKLNRTIAFIIAGAVGSWANILINQLLYNRFGGNYYLLGTVSVFSLLSGAIFAGYMGVGIYRLLVDSGVIKKPAEPKRSSLFSVPGIVAIVLIAFLAVLAGAYCVSLAQPSGGSTVAPAANGTDMHAKLYVECATGDNNTYDLADYASRFITVNAAKETKSGVEPARNYTGLPLSAIVEMQCAGGNPGHMDVIASDGYQQTFSASEVNDDVILVPNGKGLCDVVAKGKPGSMWVRDVVKIKLY